MNKNWEAQQQKIDTVGKNDETMVLAVGIHV
jgi:hypothetical protein